MLPVLKQIQFSLVLFGVFIMIVALVRQESGYQLVLLTVALPVQLQTSSPKRADIIRSEE